MLVFVDESGDTGFKLDRGSSGEFAIALVAFSDHAEAEAASQRIDQLRADLGLPSGQEFHFNQNSNSLRRPFLHAISPFEFSIFAVILDKAALQPAGIGSKGMFYNFACGLVIECARHHLANAHVTLDSTGDQAFKKQLASYIKQKMNEPADSEQRIKKVGMKPSHSDNLIQLADMVCGALARACCRDKRQTGEFRKIIKHREISVLLWPQ